MASSTGVIAKDLTAYEVRDRTNGNNAQQLDHLVAVKADGVYADVQLRAYLPLMNRKGSLAFQLTICGAS